MAKHYAEKDYKKIYKELLIDARTKGLLNLSDARIDEIVDGINVENIYALFLSVYADKISEYYEDAQKVYEANDVNLATGHDLDVIGEKLGLRRQGATSASTTLQFTTTDDLSNVLTIDKGVEVVGEDGIIYKTTESFTLSPTDKTVTVGGMSKATGSGVKVKTGHLNKILTTITGLNNLKVVNTTQSYGGNDGESDDEYRERLLHWREIEQRGNEFAYRNVLNNLDGLDDYRLIPQWDGAGTIKVICNPGTPTIKQNAYDHLQAEATLFEEDLSVVSATEYPIEIYCYINVDYDIINPYSITEKQDIKNRATQAMEDYIGTLKIGMDFIPFQAGIYVNNKVPEIKDIHFDKPSKPVVVEEESIITLTSLDVVIE